MLEQIKIERELLEMITCSCKVWHQLQVLTDILIVNSHRIIWSSFSSRDKTNWSMGESCPRQTCRDRHLKLVQVQDSLQFIMDRLFQIAFSWWMLVKLTLAYLTKLQSWGLGQLTLWQNLRSLGIRNQISNMLKSELKAQTVTLANQIK